MRAFFALSAVQSDMAVMLCFSFGIQQYGHQIIIFPIRRYGQWIAMAICGGDQFPILQLQWAKGTTINPQLTPHRLSCSGF